MISIAIATGDLMHSVRVACLVACLAAAATPATARMLEPHTCAILAAELGALEPARLIFERGAAQARATASREQLEQVRRYIDLLAQVRFRCVGGGTFVALRDGPAEDPDEAAALNAPIGRNAAGVTLPPKPEGPQVAPVAPTAPRVASQKQALPKAAPAQATADKGAAPAAPRPPTTRKKPDDAFRPPAPAAKAE
jgi:hypothetical protein